MPIRSRGVLFTSLVSAVALGLFVATLSVPFTGAGERLIFLEDALWSLSWLLIARASFREHRAGFPPRAIAPALAVELFLVIYYGLLHPWPYRPEFFANYLLWPVTSLFNLAAIALYSREELVANGQPKLFALRFLGELVFYGALFTWASRFLPLHLVMTYLGQMVIFLISLFFFLRLRFTQNTEGISVAGNLTRVLAGGLCYYVNAFVRSEELTGLLFLQVLMPLGLLLDLAFLGGLMRLRRRTQ